MQVFSALFISIFLTIAIIPVLKRYAIEKDLYDYPNNRTMHENPITKVGGIAMFIGILPAIFMWITMTDFLCFFLISSLIIVLCGFADDIYEFSYIEKLAGQFVAAILIIVYGGIKITNIGLFLPEGFLLPDFLAIPLTTITIVGVTNAFNLSDGLDGLAGGLSLISFVCIGYLAYLSSEMDIVFFSIAITGGIFGFLRFNSYPAKIFMGDAGSQFLGFSGIILAIKLTQGQASVSPVLPLFLLGFPILDTFMVMFERIFKKKSPFKADKNHFHHKLMHVGFFHTEAVFLIYILQAFLVISAFYFRYYTDWFLVAYYFGFSSIVIFLFIIADKFKLKLNRYKYFDTVIKGRLKKLKDDGVFITILNKIFVAWFLFLFIFICFIIGKMPVVFTGLLILFTLVIAIAINKKKEKIEIILRITLYLVIPCLIFLSESAPGSFVTDIILLFYNFAFAFLGLLAILILRFTRRKKGFKSSPTDFLVFIMVMVVPFIENAGNENYNMVFVAVKIIIYLFSYEVLTGELRKEFKNTEYRWFVHSTTLIFMVVSVKSFIYLIY